MASYFVCESIDDISLADKFGDKERIWGTDNSGAYVIQSRLHNYTRLLRVFSKSEDAKKFFEEEKAQFEEAVSLSNSEVSDSAILDCEDRVSLWELESLTRRGAARNRLKSKGALLDRFELNTEQLKKKRAHQLMGQILLDVLESE